MESVRKRLERLERLNPGEERQPRSPETVYARIREDARESIAENGDVLFADGRPVNHLGDFIRALDERIAALNAEIAAEEERIEEGENGWET